MSDSKQAAVAGGSFQAFRAHGVFTRPFSVTGVNRTSVVMVSLTEISAEGVPFMGGATMKVYNIVPHDGAQVEVRGEILHDVDLNVRISFLVA
ncbi:hypothetical protein FGW37_26755 [Streptomyces rectiverticillatus]|uniref:hypothetical protein n=1 Tax=Streptomyces rectiverticillatus TaxID=173860 RepID=UPI0015C38677|nr:hypothetical protein [Streptomyces rectiverticillatus]QLE74707.1 hypothetical protein FGW37_26755 [Streptomyces rectiverticillatus]